MDIGVCLPVNNFSGILVDMDSIAAQHAFHLCRCHRQAQRAADLLTDLIQTADHAKFQTAAGRCIHDFRLARTAGVSLPGKTKYLQQVYTIYNGGSRRAALPLKF